MYDFRRKRVIKFLRADSHSMDEVTVYVVRELGYTEVSPSDETYQTEYSNMRASFLLQYRPELLGDLTEPQRPQQWDSLYSGSLSNLSFALSNSPVSFG